MHKPIRKKAFSLIELSVVILIIGILIGGVSQSSRVVAQMRLASARSITQSSGVNSLKDLTAWLESTSNKSFDARDQEDGAPVDNWYDTNPQTVAKINFTQGTSTKQPSFKANAINGLPALQFDGINDLMTLTDSTKTLQDLVGVDEATIIVVHQMNIVRESNSFMIHKASDNVVRFNSHFPGVGNSVYYFDFGTCCVEGESRITGSSFPASYFNRVNIVMWMKKSTTATIRVNGTQMMSSALTGSLSSTDMASPATFLLGSNGDDPEGYFLGGYLSEVILFRRALRSEEIADVENYLSRKWAVKLN